MKNLEIKKTYTGIRTLSHGLAVRRISHYAMGLPNDLMKYTPTM